MKAIALIIVSALWVLIPVINTQGQDHPGTGKGELTANPAVEEILARISTDSLVVHVNGLVEWGTRCMYCENRKQVAEWIQSRFMAYGIPDVKLDSFKLKDPNSAGDSIWQYNVVATITGQSAPSEIHLAGAHYDSYALPDPTIAAPGADDNGTGMAALFELARIIQTSDFHPQSTLRLIAFAAEELTGITGSGSQAYAKKARERGDDIRLMLNLDVLGYNVDNDSTVWVPFIGKGPGSFTFGLVNRCIDLYSTLAAKKGSVGPDDEPFHNQGYPVSSLLEYHYNPYMHTLADTLGNMDLNYFFQNAKAACAVILSEQLTPVPQQLQQLPGKDRITLSWKGSENASIAGYSLFRKSETDPSFAALNQSPLTDTVYSDTLVERGLTYSYFVATINHDGYSSPASDTVSSAMVPADRELLVVKGSTGGFLDPGDAEVTAFYQHLFGEFPHHYTDASITDTIDLAMIGQYKRVVWLSNTYSNQPGSAFIHHRDDIFSYLRGGGNLLLSCFQPSYLIAGNTQQIATFSDTSAISSLFRIQSVYRVPSALFCGTLPVGDGYHELHVDSVKSIPQMPGNLINIETMTPAGPGATIYTFDTRADTATIQGSMKGKPVGIEYMGADYKVVTLAFPLYYMDSLQAKALVDFILREKFTSSTGIGDPGMQENMAVLFQNYPNPFATETAMHFYLPERTPVILSVLDLKGNRILSSREGELEAGTYAFRLNLGGFPAGIYIGVLSTNRQSLSVTMIKSD